MRYCDLVENPSYGRGGAQAYDEWHNPINCTWGFHRPPLLPEGGGGGGGGLFGGARGTAGFPVAPACTADAAAIRAARWAEVQRPFDNPNYGGKRRQAWATRDRPAYLHHNM